MSATAEPILIRPLTELDISRITAIDERLTGVYRPDVWERRIAYYLRRDPEACQVAEIGGRLAGFMLSDVRGGEFGLEEISGWIERFGVDPDFQGRSIGRRLFESTVAYLRQHGAVVVRTLVGPEDKDLAAFLRALGFSAAPLTPLERRLDASTPEGIPA